MPNSSPVIQEKSRVLRQNYVAALPARLELIRTAKESLLSDWSNKSARELQRHCNSLAESGATYGYPVLSTAGQRLEALLTKLLVKNVCASKDQLQTISEYVEHIGQQVSATLLMEITSSAPADKTIDMDHPITPQGKPNDKLIYLVDDDIQESVRISNIIKHAGYQVRTINHLELMEQKILDGKPAAIVMDIVFPEDSLAGAKTIKEINYHLNNQIPTIFTSIRNDMEARLAALRAGAKYFFLKPLDSHKLIKCLDEITHTHKEEPYRILIIDNDTDTANFHANIFTDVGMTVNTLQNPMKALEVMRSFQPNVILMDVHMEDCDGMELAAVIRQDETRSNVPIIFLSAKKESDAQISVLLKCGDDFLTKPVNPDHFVYIVEARARRANEISKVISELGTTLRESHTQRLAIDQHAIVSIADANGLISYVNNKFCEISKYSREEMIGQNHRVLNSHFHPKEFYERLWSTISNGKIWKGEVRNRAKDREPYWVESTIMPFLNEAGKPYQYISVGTDITPLMQSELDLRESEERLNRSQSFANMGTWDLDIKTGELYWSERTGPLFGYNEGKIHATYEKFLNAIHPDDLVMVTSAVNNCMEKAEGYDLEHRIITQSGEERWVQENGDVTRDKDGEPLHMLVVIQDITRRKYAEIANEKAQIAQEHAKNEAENANLAKSTFLSNMSHELRTPLNAILGFAQLLSHDKLHPITIEQKDSIGHILKSGWHLLELINEVLDLSKIEAGKVDLFMENVALEEVLDECICLIDALSQENNIVVHNKIDTVHQSVFLHADRKRLKQILLNLISNAIKYNSKNGSVTLSSSETEQGYFRINVTDTGIGISDENQAQLFQPFERAGAEYTDVEGTGIGLVITKKLVELMQGRIGLDSIPDEGSTFWVELKRATDADTHITKNTDYSAERASLKNSNATYTILYIEDNPANLRLVKSILKRDGRYTFLSAQNAELGLDIVRTHNPDLVLMDINLPDMDGYEALKQIQSMKSTKDIPVIALSANVMWGEIDKGRKAGFTDYLAKPIDITNFCEILDTTLANIRK